MLLGGSSEVTLEWTGVGNDWKNVKGASENILFLTWVLRPQVSGVSRMRRQTRYH